MMYRLTSVFTIFLAILALSQGSLLPAAISDATVRRLPSFFAVSEVAVRPPKPCRGKGKKKCPDEGPSPSEEVEDDEDEEDEDEDELPSESDEPTETTESGPKPLPAMCPESYILKGAVCKLVGDASVDPIMVPPTVCPKKFTLEDGMCVFKKASKMPKCPKGSKQKKGMCLVCEKPTRFKAGKCKLPKAVRPMCTEEGFELMVMDGMAMCYPM